MKNKIALCVVAICIVLCSCTSVMKSLQGDYLNSHFTTTTTSYDEVWDNVIDYFASTGITITTMEKASGLIVASKIAVPQTKEQNGKPLDPNAFVVIPDVRKYPNLATATFNVRVRDNGDSVSITVNMHDIKASYTKNNGFLIYTEPIEGKSTGVFENGLLNMFK